MNTNGVANNINGVLINTNGFGHATNGLNPHVHKLCNDTPRGGSTDSSKTQTKDLDRRRERSTR